MQAPGAQRQDRGSAGGYVSGQLPRAQPDSRDHVAEIPRDAAGSSARQEEQPPPRQAMETSPPPRASTAPRQRPKAFAAPASFRGPVYNDTLQQGGQMSLVVRRQGPPGAVMVRFEAWGGLLGSGDLAGHLSEDGRIAASGQLMVGRNPFLCTLSGVVAGGELTGSASFVRSSGGRVAHSRFTLTRS